MPIEHKILAGVLALALSHDLGRRAAKKKYKQKLEESVEVTVELWQQNLTLRSELSYLINEVLNKRDITLDEFDLIALPHVQVQ